MQPFSHSTVFATQKADNFADREDRNACAISKQRTKIITLKTTQNTALKKIVRTSINQSSTAVVFCSTADVFMSL